MHLRSGYDRGRMRIAVDARALEAQPTGVGRYLEELVGAWLDRHPGDTFVLLSCRPVFAGRLAGRVETVPGDGRVPGTIWLQTHAGRLARDARAEVFLGPLGVLPLASELPGVATIHDLTPLLFPAWHSLKNRLGFIPFLRPTIRRARAVAAVSRATLRDLVDQVPEADEKAEVVHNGVSVTAPERAPATPGEPYVLFLGTLEPRKNVLRLVEAAESLWDRYPAFPDLALAGGDGWGLPDLPARLEASRHRARIRRLGYVDRETSLRLVRDARLLAYPSLYEGFGLPPLEALALGTPVVGSSASSLPEVLGDVALLPDPTSVPAIAAALLRAETDETWRRHARQAGPERAGLFTWGEAARRMRSLCERAAS